LLITYSGSLTFEVRSTMHTRTDQYRKTARQLANKKTTTHVSTF